MLIEVIKQPELHNADFTKYKYYLAFFNNYSMLSSNTEYLKTSIDNTDEQVINSLKNSYTLPNESNHIKLINLIKVILFKGRYIQASIYMDKKEA